VGDINLSLVVTHPASLADADARRSGDKEGMIKVWLWPER